MFDISKFKVERRMLNTPFGLCYISVVGLWTYFPQIRLIVFRFSTHWCGGMAAQLCNIGGVKVATLNHIEDGRVSLRYRSAETNEQNYLRLLSIATLEAVPFLQHNEGATDD